jgi:hypothetical protein
VTTFALFGGEVGFIVGIGRHPVREATGDVDAALTESLDLVGVVRDQAYAFDAKLFDHLRRHVVPTFIIAETESVIRFDRVETGILKRVRTDFVHETDATPFLPKVKDNAMFLRANKVESGLQLVAAVALQAAHDIARKTLAMDAERNVGRTANLPFDDGTVFFPVDRLERDHGKVPVAGRKACRSADSHKSGLMGAKQRDLDLHGAPA